MTNRATQDRVGETAAAARRAASDPDDDNEWMDRWYGDHTPPRHHLRLAVALLAFAALLLGLGLCIYR
jgi:hypothetical protein